jgi:hypothetical protein
MEEDDTNNMWEKMATCIQKLALEVCGVTKGSRGEAIDNWWWNEEVQRAIIENKKMLHMPVP